MLVSGIVACMPRQHATGFELTVLESFINITIPFDPVVQGFGIRRGDFKIHRDIVRTCKCGWESGHRSKAPQWCFGAAAVSVNPVTFSRENEGKKGDNMYQPFRKFRWARVLCTAATRFYGQDFSLEF